MIKRRPRLLVVGSFVMDTITRTEAFPLIGQTVMGYSYMTAPGGKGANQAVGASLLGADVTMVGKVGQDDFGDRLCQALSSRGVDTTHVSRAEEGISSGIGNVIVTTRDGQAVNNRIIVIPGANLALTLEDVAFLREEIAKFDMVILQFEIPMDVNTAVAAFANAKGVPVMVNPAPIAPIPPELMSNITYLSPNETEAAAILGCPVREENGIITSETEAEIQKAMKAKGLDRLLLTLGDAGALLVFGDASVYRDSVKGLRVIDPTAAGDSFVAAFCVGKCIGLEDGDALSFGNMIAAVTVSGAGAMPSLPTLDGAIAFHASAGRDTALLEKVKELLP